jgi:hypothetical protein
MAAANRGRRDNYCGVMIPPTGVRWGYFFAPGRVRCMASAMASVYLRPEPVLKRTTRSLGVRKPVESRWS